MKNSPVRHPILELGPSLLHTAVRRTADIQPNESGNPEGERHEDQDPREGRRLDREPQRDAGTSENDLVEAETRATIDPAAASTALTDAETQPVRGRSFCSRGSTSLSLVLSRIVVSPGCRLPSTFHRIATCCRSSPVAEAQLIALPRVPFLLAR